MECHDQVDDARNEVLASMSSRLPFEFNRDPVGITPFRWPPYGETRDLKGGYYTKTRRMQEKKNL